MNQQHESTHPTEQNMSRPLSLEEAIAMAPANLPHMTFTASTAAIAWGAVRSGRSVWEYIIGMTQEFEARLQEAYEQWKAENAWYRNPPQTPDIEDPVADTPITVEKPAIADDAEVNSGNTEKPEVDAKEAKEAAITSVGAEPAAAEEMSVPEQPAPTASEALNHAIASLPKEPDTNLYESVLAMADLETVRTALTAFIEKRKRIHRPRAAQAAFLKWIDQRTADREV